MVLEAQQAQAAVAGVKERPAGIVRFSCPTGLLETVTPLLASFLAAYPDVTLDVVTSNSPLDLIDQRVDVSLRVRFSLDGDASLTMRAVATSTRILVAAPLIAAQIDGETDPECLTSLPSLAFSGDDLPEVWQLVGPNRAERAVRVAPRLICGEFSVIRAAAAAGLGVGLLPEHFCQEELHDGRLVRLLPQWSKQSGLVHLVFTTKRGLTPAVRALIDHLVIGIKEEKALGLPSEFSVRPAGQSENQAPAA
jgi:DNA-binding transcriptional LysR family regulator